MVPLVPVSACSREGEPQQLGNRLRGTFRDLFHYGSPLLGYGLSFLLTCATGLLRLEFMSGVSWAPFFFFYPAVALGAFLGGAGPGLAAASLAGVFAVLFIPGSPTISNWIALVVCGPLTSILFAHVRQIRDQSRAAARELVRFKFISDHANDWILLLRESGHIRYANQTACAELGFIEEDLMGRHIESLVPEPQRPLMKTLLDDARAGSAKPIEVTFERKDQSLVLVELGYTTVRTNEDGVIYAAARDIGDRKQIYQKLQEVRHWESLGVLAGGLAHDFNNLLTSIMGYASLAKEVLPHDHQALLLLENIVTAGERSADLVRMMQATSGYRPRYHEPLRIDQLLDWMLENRPLPPAIRISREVQSASFQGDRRSLETLLWSLILNAAESYGKEEGVVRIIIRRGTAPRGEKASFQEGDTGPGECLGIIVEDAGSGMGPEILERIFDPFFSTKFPGRGLGLPAVRGIVRAYSGKLLLRTTPGQGTRVEVWLPPAPAVPAT
jgi:PAS domain S-box-containing protein